MNVTSTWPLDQSTDESFLGLSWGRLVTISGVLVTVATTGVASYLGDTGMEGTPVVEG